MKTAMTAQSGNGFATHRRERGRDIRTGEEPSGRSDVTAAMIYTHLLSRGGRGVLRPADDRGGVFSQAVGFEKDEGDGRKHRPEEDQPS